jgi:hypothetical protein
MCVRRPLAAAVLALAASAASAQVSAPVLKWQRGGCGSSCQTGWYASPAVADLDGDGQAEVVWAAYDLVAVNGATGALRWRSPSPNRVWPGVVVADLTGDGTLEVVVGRNSDTLAVHDRAGTVLWTRHPFGSGEIRTLAVADVDGDGRLEIVVGRASGGSFQQLSVYDAAGNVRPGWPARRVGEAGNGWGMYNENVAVGDVNGDGRAEIIGPTDTHYITALDADGNQLPANPMYGAGKVWSQVGVHVDHAVDLRGYANCGTEHRPNFANSAPIIADVDGDGTREIIVIGDVYDCAVGDDVFGDLYHMPWIFKLDRTRWSGSGFDWTVLPTPPPNSRPLSEDYDVIQNSVQNAVAADLDGDGRKEILFASYDGRLHAYGLDKTEHGSWPYKVPGTGMRFAGEPVVTDLDGDGHAEVIFTSWPENVAGRVGQLHVLDYLGHPLYTMDLPAPPTGNWNGGLAAPTLANIDADPDLELVIGTWSTGIVAYDLPGTAGARVLWGTGRGSVRRTGMAAASPAVSVSDAAAPEGHVGTGLLAFTVSLSEPSVDPVAVDYTTLPGSATAGVDYVPRAGTVTFAPGLTERTILVGINGDETVEPDETLVLRLTAARGGRLTDDTGNGIIQNDDPVAAAAFVDQYRLYLVASGEHLYTTDPHEYAVLGGVGWLREGIAYKLFTTPGSYNGVRTVPYYRLYHRPSRQHHWTRDTNEATVLAALPDWNFEGAIGSVLPSIAGPSVPLYRLRLPSPLLHLWTIDPNERRVLTGGVWVDEGVTAHVVP